MVKWAYFSIDANYTITMSCYNFTIHDMATKEGYCYVWDKSVAKRGADEVASCLYNFIKDFSRKGVREFRFWSDNCGGQIKIELYLHCILHCVCSQKVWGHNNSPIFGKRPYPKWGGICPLSDWKNWRTQTHLHSRRVETSDKMGEYWKSVRCERCFLGIGIFNIRAFRHFMYLINTTLRF